MTAYKDLTAEEKAKYIKRVRLWQHSNKDKLRQYQNTPESKLRNRKNKVQKKYGLTLDEWDMVFKSQGCCCAICGTDDPGTFWCTDHDHETGIFRGILCHPCNTLCTKRHTTKLLYKAAVYMEDGKTKVFGWWKSLNEANS